MRACIDTHQHLWNPSRFSYSWMNGLPTLNVVHAIREYREATQGFEVEGSVYVDTDVDECDLGAEIGWVLALAEDPANRILGVVASARLERQDAFAHLEPYRGHPLLKGVRRVLHTQNNTIFENPQFLANLAKLERRGLSFDICVRCDQLPLALALVQRFPQVSFVLDHCGAPDLRSGALQPWAEQIRAIAKEANVVCKLSGLVAYVDPDNWSEETLKPVVDTVLDAFGWQRVLWGSDWPVCTLACPLQRWMEVARELTAHGTSAELDAVFSDNARRVYRLAARGEGSAAAG